MPVESLDHTHGRLLRLGARVEVLAPDKLRVRLAETAPRLAKMYA